MRLCVSIFLYILAIGDAIVKNILPIWGSIYKKHFGDLGSDMQKYFGECGFDIQKYFGGLGFDIQKSCLFCSNLGFPPGVVFAKNVFFFPLC